MGAQMIFLCVLVLFYSHLTSCAPVYTDVLRNATASEDSKQHLSTEVIILATYDSEKNLHTTLSKTDLQLIGAQNSAIKIGGGGKSGKTGGGGKSGKVTGGGGKSKGRGGSYRVHRTLGGNGGGGTIADYVLIGLFFSSIVICFICGIACQCAQERAKKNEQAKNLIINENNNENVTVKENNNENVTVKEKNDINKNTLSVENTSL